MTLDEYLVKHRETSADFAERSGIGHKQTVHNYRKGIRFPTPDNLRRIQEATAGQVTANDFVDQHTEAQIQAPRSPQPEAA